MDPRFYLSQAILKVGVILGVWMWQIAMFSAFSLFAIVRTISPYALYPLKNFVDPSILAYQLNGTLPLYHKDVKRKV